jgi:hypothetical protein
MENFKLEVFDFEGEDVLVGVDKKRKVFLSGRDVCEILGFPEPLYIIAELDRCGWPVKLRGQFIPINAVAKLCDIAQELELSPIVPLFKDWIFDYLKPMIWRITRHASKPQKKIDISGVDIEELIADALVD